MAVVTFAKVSGVLSITQTSGYPKYYAATAIANAKFSPNSAGDGVLIIVGGDPYEIKATNIKVNSTTATTIGDALTLLNSIFGT